MNCETTQVVYMFKADREQGVTRHARFVDAVQVFSSSIEQKQSNRSLRFSTKKNIKNSVKFLLPYKL